MFPRFVVYIGSHSGHFIAVELAGGRLLWTAQFEEETPPTAGVDGDDEDDLKRRNRRRIEATAACSSDGERIFVGKDFARRLDDFTLLFSVNPTISHINVC